MSDTVRKTVEIHAPASKVWAFLTQPDKINLWMMDTPTDIQSAWEAGSSLVFKGDLHGIPYENKGVILQYEPEALLAYTHWSSLSQRPDEPAHYGVITFRLTTHDTITTLEFTQTNAGAYATERHINFYWTTALGLIKKLNEAD